MFVAIRAIKVTRAKLALKDLLVRKVPVQPDLKGLKEMQACRGIQGQLGQIRPYPAQRDCKAHREDLGRQAFKVFVDSKVPLVILALQDSKVR